MHFRDISAQAGLMTAPHSSPIRRYLVETIGGGLLDCDNNGWPDLFVTNEGGQNDLYHNKRDGTFLETGIASGTGLGPDGEAFGDMAADLGDFDRDGNLDLIATRSGKQLASIDWNGGRGFTDVATEARITRPTYAPVKWGAGFEDIDNDAWPDILIANGNFSSLMDTLENKVKYREPIQLFRNLGNRTFEEITDRSGFNNGILQPRRGTAFGDISNDGNREVVVFSAVGPPSLFIYETHNANHHVLFRLIGTKSNRAAIGARLTVFSSRMSQIDEVRDRGSYKSTNDTHLHFGLGGDAVMERVRVQRPSGLKQEFQDVAGDAIIEMEEGKGTKKTLRLPAPKN